MNKTVLLGRLTRNPDIRTAGNDVNNPKFVARYTLAVRRKFSRDGEPDADFINCVAFGANAEFARKYLKQGIKICISGRIQTGNYEKNGQRINTWDVIVEEQEFVESKAASNVSQQGQYQNRSARNEQPSTYGSIPQADIDQFMNIPDDCEEIPFLD